MNMMTYDTSARVMQVIERIAQGYTITRACREYSMTVATFQRAVKNDDMLHTLFVEATQVGQDTLADSLIRPDDLSELTGASDMGEMKLASDNIKWLLARRNQAAYGDNVTVTHNITADKAIVSALQRGQERAMAKRLEQDKGDVEDAAFEVVDPLAEFL